MNSNFNDLSSEDILDSLPEKLKDWRSNYGYLIRAVSASRHLGRYSLSVALLWLANAVEPDSALVKMYARLICSSVWPDSADYIERQAQEHLKAWRIESAAMPKLSSFL